MAAYYTCPVCGATLDPGEKCDCKECSVPQKTSSSTINYRSADMQRAFTQKKKAAY